MADPFQNLNKFNDGNPTNPDVSAIVTRINRYRTCKGTTGTTACA